MNLSVNGQIPISLIIDDSAPGINPMYFFDEDPSDLYIPNTLLDDAADLFEEFGVQGKFTVVPMVFGMGRIDGPVQHVTRDVVSEFLDTVRSRIVPLFDITPEILTHANAYDLATGKLLEIPEDEYFEQIGRDVMTDYIALALEILKNAGLDANGVTSPWMLGETLEDDYSLAILDAQKRVHGRKRTWYFLHQDDKADVLTHRVMHRPANDEWVVSICSGTPDFAWNTQKGMPGQEDALIAPDGRSGRLVELSGNGSSIVMLTHWQSLYSRGTCAGLLSLRRILERIRDHLGARVIWTRTSRLAELVAETAVVL